MIKNKFKNEKGRVEQSVLITKKCQPPLSPPTPMENTSKTGGGASGLSLGKLGLHVGGVRSVHGRRGYRQSAVGPAVGASAEGRSGLGLADHGAGLWSRVAGGQREVPQPQRLPQPGSASCSWRSLKAFSEPSFPGQQSAWKGKQALP